MVADRPLVRTINPTKAIVNRLARWVRYKEYTRHPALRPIACASPADSRCVSDALAQYASCETHFACSNPVDVNRQRQRMLAACKAFALEYGLRFTP